MAILVCGGAGYIGSHTVRQLVAAGEDVIVADNFSTGHRRAIDPAAKIYRCDIRDKDALKKIFAAENIEAVIHFAAFIEAGESVRKPLKYFDNNVCGTEILLEAMVEGGVDKIIFSSSAAVYGEPERIPIDEDDQTLPVNPYGSSKLMMEMMMRSVAAAHSVKFVSLRYFNASGAIEDGSIGEDHHPETHLIPLILQVPLGQRDNITVFGTDYPTPDGTCIRDYVHVLDLAAAHLNALNYLRGGGSSDFFNLGNGRGFSVREIIDAAEKIVGKKISTVFGERRPGDPARLIASGAKARRILNWTPRFDDVEKIIGTAWRWHSTHPFGYGD